MVARVWILPTEENSVDKWATVMRILICLLLKILSIMAFDMVNQILILEMLEQAMLAGGSRTLA